MIGYLVFGDRPGLSTIVGGSVIILSGLLVLRTTKDLG